MNRNTLMIAIAAIAVVGIAVGLLLAGDGQTGPLTGDIGLVMKATTLSTRMTVLGEGGTGSCLLSLHGKLSDSTGAPVANRAVTIRCHDLQYYSIIHDPRAVTTRADGTFEAQYEEPANYSDTINEYFAAFAGDEQYYGSTSNNVQGF